MNSKHSNIDSCDFVPLLDYVDEQQGPLAVEMMAVEHEYFANDKLEYRPDDWVPACKIMTKPFAFHSYKELQEMESFLLKEFSGPCSLNDSVCMSRNKGKVASFLFGVEWKNGMPMAHPVTQKEYHDLPRNLMCESSALYSGTSLNPQHSETGSNNFDDVVAMLSAIENEDASLDHQNQLQKNVAFDLCCFKTQSLSSTNTEGIGATFSSRESELPDGTMSATTVTRHGATSTGSFISLTSENASRKMTSCSKSSFGTRSSRRCRTPMRSVGNKNKRSALRGKNLFQGSLLVQSEQNRRILLSMSTSSAVFNAKHVRCLGQPFRSNDHRSNTSNAAPVSPTPHIRFSFSDGQPRSRIHKPVSSIWVRRSTRRLFLDPDTQVDQENKRV